MAHFYGGVHGNRGEATRLGTKNSGLEAFCNGWQAGVRVYAYVNDNGQDSFRIFATSGSGPKNPSGNFIGQVTENADGFKFEPNTNTLE